MNLINDNLNILNTINDNSLEETDKKKTFSDTLIKKEKIIVNKDNNIASSLNNSINKTYFKKLKNFSNIKYGIDENGNPINISQYFNNKRNIEGNKKPRLIAYIAKDGNKNILLDLNGNKILKKNEEGDYEFPFLLNILIKDFDVQHPELRVNGERRYTNPISKENTINNNSEKKCENNLINGIKGKIIKYKYYSKNNSIDKENNNNKVEKYFQNRNLKRKENILKNIRLNKTSNNSIDYNYYFGNKKEIISRTNSILNIIKSNKKNYNFKDYNLYSLSNKNKDHNIILYNINNKKKIPVNPYHKNKFIKPKINIVEISNNINENFNKIDYSLNLNSSKNINNDFIIKKKYKYSFTVNNSNGNLPSYDINHNDNISTSTNTYNDINNETKKFNLKYKNNNNNKKIDFKMKKDSKEKLINTNKYLNNETIIINKYLPNYTENNINNNLNENKKNKFKMINKKLSLNKIKHSYIRTIESSENKTIKGIEKNKSNNSNKDNKNNNRNKYRISKLFPNIFYKKVKNNRYSILSKEANNMIKNFSSRKKLMKSRNNVKKKINLNHIISRRYISSPLIIQKNIFN